MTEQRARKHFDELKSAIAAVADPTVPYDTVIAEHTSEEWTLELWFVFVGLMALELAALRGMKPSDPADSGDFFRIESDDGWTGDVPVALQLMSAVLNNEHGTAAALFRAQKDEGVTVILQLMWWVRTAASQQRASNN